MKEKEYTFLLSLPISLCDDWNSNSHFETQVNALTLGRWREKLEDHEHS